MMETTRIDMHVHTRGSDGVGSGEEIAAAAIAAGLDGLCLTDHHTTYNDENLEVARICTDAGLRVFHGCEYSTAQGHLLIYGVDVADLRLGMYPQMQRVIDDVNRSGGICVPAHPFASRYQRHLGTEIYEMHGISHLETINGQQAWQDPEANLTAATAALTIGLCEFGGSDAHVASHVGLASTVFPGVVKTMDDMLAALGYALPSTKAYLDVAVLRRVLESRRSNYLAARKTKRR